LCLNRRWAMRTNKNRPLNALNRLTPTHKLAIKSETKKVSGKKQRWIVENRKLVVHAKREASSWGWSKAVDNSQDFESNKTKSNDIESGSSPLCCGTGAHCLVFTVVMLPMRDCGERIRSRAILYKYFKQDLSFNGTVGIMTFPRS